MVRLEKCSKCLFPPNSELQHQNKTVEDSVSFFFTFCAFQRHCTSTKMQGILIKWKQVNKPEYMCILHFKHNWVRCLRSADQNSFNIFCPQCELKGEKTANFT